MDKPYIHAAQQGRDEPPAEQCRMGVSMGYPPLTQNFSAKKIILKNFSSKKNLCCGKIQLNGLYLFCLLELSCYFIFKTILFDSLIVPYYSFL